MATKTKIILVGGMDFNIPRELKERFDIVKHISHSTKYQSLPTAEFVFVLTEWANHSMVATVRESVGIPVVWLPRGWTAIRQELEKRSILAPEEEPTTTSSASAQTVPAPSVLGLSESDLWKKYKGPLMEAAKGTLKPLEKVSEDDLLEALTLSGLPKEDCKTLLPRLQMGGVIDPCENGRWRLMAAQGHEYDYGKSALAPPEEQVPQKLNGREPSALSRIKKVPNSVYFANLVAGLPRGPYASKRAIYRKMRDYKEFAPLSDKQVIAYVERAIALGIVDDTNKDFIVKVKEDVVLQALPAAVVEPELPSAAQVKRAQAGVSLDSFQAGIAAPRGKMSKDEAERAWCHVVENIRKERERLATVLGHCRIEWSAESNMVYVLLPGVLSSWMNFVQSTENWGLVMRSVHDKFSRETVIRFTVDNGHRS